MDRAATEERVAALIEPFNKKGIAITDATTLLPAISNGTA